jgi:hypothetical protein
MDEPFTFYGEAISPPPKNKAFFSRETPIIYIKDVKN